MNIETYRGVRSGYRGKVRARTARILEGGILTGVAKSHREATFYRSHMSYLIPIKEYTNP